VCLRGLIFTIKQVSVNNISVFNSGTYMAYTDLVKKTCSSNLWYNREYTHYVIPFNMKHMKIKTLLHTGKKSAKQILTNKGFSQQNMQQFFVFDCYMLQYLVSINFKFQRTLQNFVNC
jgi:hypothetical protein